jgi:DNA-binding transcriptional regulator YhcF (GntR family)
MIKLAKTKLAREQVSAFLEKMELLGFEQTEILEIINGMVEEMRK